MPAVTLTPTTISRAGVDHAAAFAAAAAGGNNWATTGVEWAEVANGSGSPITVSLVITRQVDGVTPVPRTVSVPAGKTYKIGPFTSDYNDTSSPALATITYSAVGSVTVALFKLGT